MSAVLEFRNVSVVRDGNIIVDDVSWDVHDDERWVIIGPNGAGKISLLLLATAHEHPTDGSVRVLDEEVGASDVFGLRPRLGLASTAMARQIPLTETVVNVVMTAAWAVTGRWNEQYDAVDEARARHVLSEWKLDHLADRTFGTLSDGEQKRTMIARAVMTDPEILSLDEPAASLDLGSREELIRLLGDYASAPNSPVILMVTHHVEEIPPGFTHALVVREGSVVSAGPIESTLTSAVLSKAFGIPITVTKSGGRFSARGD